MDVLLSIALVTRNRPDLLESCLYSLFKQDNLWHEILISDDSTDDLAIESNKKISTFYRARYLKGPQKGLYANRNFIAKQCTGTHIRTVDDDHTFPPNHISTCINTIKEDPKSVWIIGEYLLGVSPHEAPHPCPGELHPRGFAVTPKDPQNSRAISCGATIYPREIIDKNVLNIDYFKFGNSYLEYGSRLKFMGYRIRHISETFVFHNFNPHTRSFNNRLEILDSRVYSVLALSFIYNPTIFNKVSTIAAIGGAIIFKKYTFKMLGENLKRMKNVKSSF